MNSSRSIYILMLLVLLLIIIGLIYRFTRNKKTDNAPAETHTGYPY